MKSTKYIFDRPSLGVVYLMTLSVMFFLKKYYSTASADQLLWMLQPVAWIVSATETLPYAWIADVGYIRADHAITIAPACAGVNFMIMAIGLPVASFAHRQKPFSRRLMLWIATVWGAYILAILVNATRIIASVALYDARLCWGWLTPDRLHRMAGIAVYFSALGLYYMLWHRIITGDADSCKTTSKRWLPWLWYITGAVAVPVVHQLFIKKPWPGVEYCLTVIGVSGLLWAVAKVGLDLIQTKSEPCIKRACVIRAIRGYKIDQESFNAPKDPNCRR